MFISAKTNLFVSIVQSIRSIPSAIKIEDVLSILLIRTGGYYATVF